MGRILPMEIDEQFFVGVLLIFLMINWDLPQSSIYSWMVVFSILMYLVPIIWGLFRWIPITKKQNSLMSIGIGVGIGIAYLWLYDYLKVSIPMASVYGAPAFAQSKFIGMAVFGVLVAAIEVMFFFRSLLQWVAYKGGWSVNQFSVSALWIIIAAVFTIFHATTAGISDQFAWLAIFIFGLIQVAEVLIFQELLPAIATHVYINSKSVGLIDAITTGGLMSSSWIIIAGVIGVILVLNRKKLGLHLA